MNTQDANGSDLPPGLGAPAQRALAGAGYSHLEQLTRVTAAELKQLHGMGPIAIDLLRRAMQKKGMAFSGETSETHP